MFTKAELDQHNRIEDAKCTTITLRPWKAATADTASICIYDATNKPVVVCGNATIRGEDGHAVAALIVHAVNAYDALRAENAALRYASSLALALLPISKERDNYDEVAIALEDALALGEKGE